MRKIYHNFTNEKDIEDNLILNEKQNTHIKINETNNDFVNKVINKLSEDFEFEVKEQSYWRIEHRPGGHKWHQDTGTRGHMAWCQVGVSLLLQDSSSGGQPFYGKLKDDKKPTKLNRKVYDLVAHTSDEWHMVTPHKGRRIVFLMFI